MADGASPREHERVAFDGLVLADSVSLAPFDLGSMTGPVLVSLTRHRY